MSTLQRTALSLVFATLFACTGGPTDDRGTAERSAETEVSVGRAAERLAIAASLPPLAFLAAEVGGERVRLETLIPQGRSPHTHEPAPRELARLSGVDLFFRVGRADLRFEERAAALLAAGGGEGGPRQLTLVEVARGLGEPRLAAEPHPWLSPPVLAAAARRLGEVLGEIEPAGRAGFAGRAEALAGRIEVLDRELEERLSASPCRTFLVDHPAWGAFAERYDLRQLAIESEGKQPGPATLRAVVDEARSAGVRRLWVEPGMPIPGSRRVAEELGAEVVEVDPLSRDVLATLRRAAELVVGGCAGD